MGTISAVKTTHSSYWLLVAGLWACSILSACQQQPSAELQSPKEEIFNGIRVKYSGVNSEKELEQAKAYAHKYLNERGYTKDSVGSDGSITFGQESDNIISPFTTYEALFTRMRERDRSTKQRRETDSIIGVIKQHHPEANTRPKTLKK